MPGTLSCESTRSTPCRPLHRECYPSLFIRAVTGLSYKIATLLTVSAVKQKGFCITPSCRAFGQRQGHDGSCPQAPALQHAGKICAAAAGYPSMGCTHRLTALRVTPSSERNAPPVRMGAPRVPHTLLS